MNLSLRISSKNAVYVIKFNSSTNFEIINTTLWEVMAYNPTFPADGGGYVVLKDPNTGETVSRRNISFGCQHLFRWSLHSDFRWSLRTRPSLVTFFRVVSTPSQALGDDAGVRNFLQRYRFNQRT